MAKGNLAACLALTLRYEGGYSDNKKDPGGATMRGITIGRLREVRGKPVTKADVKALGMPETETIYDRYYWRPVRGDDLPAGVDLAVFDFGVNSGPSRSARYLQAVLKVRQDGKIGNATIAAASKANGKAVIQTLCGKRLGFMQGLPIWQTFKGGWAARVASVEAKGVAMWLRIAGRSTEAARADLSLEGAKARMVSTKQHAANGAVAGGGAITGGDQALALHPDWLLIGCMGAALLVVVVVLAVKASQNKARARAYAVEAAAI